MNWPTVRAHWLRTQRELEINLALIQDALKDTESWLSSEPSEEERTHVLTMQERLNELAKIAELGMEGPYEVRAGWEWPEAVAELLSRLEQAKELCGGIVGKGLARLPDRLARELPGSQPTHVISAPGQATKPTGEASKVSAQKALEASESGSRPQHRVSRAQNSDKTAQGVESEPVDRHAMVDAYIEEVRSKSGKPITRKDIWSKAGYKSRTEFERWERRDPKHPNKAADKTFTRILSVEKPHLK
jgi:hypothetical protein